MGSRDDRAGTGARGGRGGVIGIGDVCFFLFFRLLLCLASFCVVRGWGEEVTGWLSFVT